MLQPEQAEVVNKLIVFTSSFAVRTVAKDEVTLCQGCQSVTQPTAKRQTCGFCYLFTCETVVAFSQKPDDLLAILRICEDGFEESVELILQSGSVAEEYHVSVSLEAVAFAEITQIIWNASKHHIRLYNIVPRQFYVFMVEVVLAFLQRERVNLDFICKAAIQSPFVPRQVFEHPGCCATTDNEHHVVMVIAPSVPEVLKG